jgi:alpha-amylase/alpha-mannosidase (GH57 family)
MDALVIHGHFYQPPRENPWTGVVDPEPSARPFHDWNERVYSECYEPNSAAPIISPNGAKRIVNNYAHLSFDFGPTLLSWLERNHSETYRRIIAADAESVLKHNGHGNAIAQAYNHAILPLCTERDRRTQVRWGLADFRHRFKRESESIWLPETACNDDVLDLLIDEGIRFVILAPHQAKRIRNDSGKWVDALPETLDTSIPYKSFHRDRSGRSIAVFFYDRTLAHDIAFGQALTSSNVFVDRLVQSGRSGLINVATDGETFGHHHKFGDLCLAYALELDAPARGITMTNYGEYLDARPPEVEFEISNGNEGEGSSWSCVHGVSRWIRDCGCETNSRPGWNQSWRGPLRRALDYLRDEAAAPFAATEGELFADPWAARDDAIQLMLNERMSREEFLRKHAPRELGQADQARALLFLELQRNALLMYTSCGWFFNDIAGIEPVQILKYAARVIDLMNQLGLPSPRERFLEILAEARSNRPEMGSGADIFRKQVEPLTAARASHELTFR